MTRFFGLIFALAATASLASCGGGSESDTTPIAASAR